MPKRSPAASTAVSRAARLTKMDKACREAHREILRLRGEITELRDELEKVVDDYEALGRDAQQLVVERDEAVLALTKANAAKVMNGSAPTPDWRSVVSRLLGTPAPPAPPVASTRTPFDVLGVLPTAEVDVIDAAHRALAMKYHPDRGGSHDRMAELNAAKAWVDDYVERRKQLS